MREFTMEDAGVSPHHDHPPTDKLQKPSIKTKVTTETGFIWFQFDLSQILGVDGRLDRRNLEEYTAFRLHYTHARFHTIVSS